MGYDEMSLSDQIIFDQYITRYNEYHQENDARLREEIGYHNMTDADKDIFNLKLILLKAEDEYYDMSFNEIVEEAIEMKVFQALDDNDQIAVMHGEDPQSYEQFYREIRNDVIDILAEHGLNFYSMAVVEGTSIETFCKVWARDKVYVRQVV